MAITAEERDLLAPLVERGIEPRTTLLGLREQTGTHNNLNAGEPTQEWGVSGATFIRLVPANFWDYVSGVDYTPGTTVTDATPRMISRTITTGGMVLLEDAAGQIVYWSSDRYAAEPDYAATIDGWNAEMTSLLLLPTPYSTMK